MEFETVSFETAIPYGKISSNFMRNHKFSHDTDDFFIIFYDKNFISLKSHYLMRFFIVKTDLEKFQSPNHQTSYEISLIS